VLDIVVSDHDSDLAADRIGRTFIGYLETRIQAPPEARPFP
jgi:hypothetical protein